MTPSLLQKGRGIKKPLEESERGKWKSWLTSSVQDWESFSSRDDMGCTEHSSTCSTEIDDPLYLRRLSKGVSRGS